MQKTIRKIFSLNGNLLWMVFSHLKASQIPMARLMMLAISPKDNTPLMFDSQIRWENLITQSLVLDVGGKIQLQLVKLSNLKTMPLTLWEKLYSLRVRSKIQKPVQKNFLCNGLLTKMVIGSWFNIK